MFIQEMLGQNVVGDNTNGRGGRVLKVNVGVACVCSLMKFRCLSMSFATTLVSAIVSVIVSVTIGKMGHSTVYGAAALVAVHRLRSCGLGRCPCLP